VTCPTHSVEAIESEREGVGDDMKEGGYVEEGERPEEEDQKLNKWFSH
jgi:hypothetical protein